MLGSRYGCGVEGHADCPDSDGEAHGAGEQVRNHLLGAGIEPGRPYLESSSSPSTDRCGEPSAGL